MKTIKLKNSGRFVSGDSVFFSGNYAILEHFYTLDDKQVVQQEPFDLADVEMITTITSEETIVPNKVNGTGDCLCDNNTCYC